LKRVFADMLHLIADPSISINIYYVCRYVCRQIHRYISYNPEVKEISLPLCLFSHCFSLPPYKESKR
ncbi:hypothetical protein CSUI_009114, partial [Cystoisospora suis]